MNSRLLVFALCSLLFLPAKAELTPPRDSVPEDHLAWFSLRGPVAEVVEYDYNNYGKTIWRFDTRGRLTEYYEYTHPFFENGGCVFCIWALINWNEFTTMLENHLGVWGMSGIVLAIALVVWICMKILF